MSSYHILKTRTAPPTLFAAGKGVGRRFPLVLTYAEYKAHQQELLQLKGQGYITIEEVKEAAPPEPPPAPAVEPDPEPAPEPEPEPVTEELADEIDEARAEPEPEALDEKPEEVVEVPPEEPADEPVEEDPEVYDTTLLDQAVKGLVKDLAEITDPAWLRALRAAENLGKTRKSAIAAIKERLEALEG